MNSYYFVYIVQCADGSLYVGITTDVWKRIRMHNGEIAGGAKYTRGKRPVILRYVESGMTKQQASRREYALKHLNHEQKKHICDAFTCVVNVI